MEYVIPKHQLGWLCNVLDVETFGRELATRLTDSIDFRPSPDFLAFVAFNTPERFAEQWKSSLQGRLFPQNNQL